MADGTPGQVFGPQNNSSDPQQQPESPQAELNVQLPRPQGQESPVQAAPVPPVYTQPTPQPAHVAPAAPTAPASTPPESSIAPAPATSPVSPYALESPTPMIEQPSVASSEDSPAPSGLEPISWTASEYVAHHKDPSWYLGLSVIALVIVAAVYFITGRDMVSALSIVFVAVLFGVYAARKPNVREYALSRDGVTIADRVYSFNTIKSFSIVNEGPFKAVNFVPLKRFMLMPAIFCDPADEERIVNFLLNYLPFEEPKNDPFDRAMRKFKF